MIKSNLGRKGLIWFTHLELHSIERSQVRSSNQLASWRKEMMQRPWRSAAYSIFLMSCSAWFLIEPRTTSPVHHPQWAGSSLVNHELRKCSAVLPMTWSFFKKLFIYLFNVYECTVAVFRHTRRGHRIPLQMVVSHHVVAGKWTQDLWKSSQCS